MQEESFIQQAIVSLCRYKGLLCFAVPNGLYLNTKSKASGIKYMNRMKREGLLPGVSDLVLVLPDKIVFIEVKTKRGKQSDNQISFENRVSGLGYEYVIWRSVDDANNYLKENNI